MHALLDTASQRDPRSHRYGFYSVGPPIAAVGMFFWYSTPAEMVRGIVMASALDDGPEGEELLALLRVADQAASLASDECTAALKHLDQRLCWAGTYEGLSTGDNEFARELRADYRSMLDEEPDEPEAPIQTDEIDEWLEHLEAYGH